MRQINYIVIRRPVLMEDEGRYFVECQFLGSREAAQSWINAQTGFFHPGNFFIAED